MAKAKLLLVLAAALGISAGVVRADINDGLVAHWRFDEGTGNTSYDSAGTNDGTIYGATWTMGRIGAALDFDGADDCVNVADDDSLNIPGEITVSAWVKADGYQGNDGIVFKGGAGNNQRYKLTFSNGRVFFERNTTDGYKKLAAPEVSPTGIWVHVTGVYDGTYMRAYEDGEEKNSINVGSNIISFLGYPLVVGVNKYWNAYFDGIIDDVRIYNRALSAEEVSDLYQDGLGELVSLEIAGPNEVPEYSQSQYKAIAVYANNSTKDVTASAIWLVEPNLHAQIDAGLLTTSELDVPEEDVTIYAQYGEGDVTKDGQKDVTVFAVCPSGSALEFDGGDDYVEIADDSSISLLSEGSISAWFRTLSPFSGDTRLISKDAPGSNPGDSTIIFRRDQTVDFYIYGDADPMLESATTIESNHWYFIVVTWDGANKLMYINGIQEPETSGSQNPALNSVSPLYIGSGGPSQFFNGQIDEVAIYNRALSAGEVQKLMHNRPDIMAANLVAYWNLDEGQGQIAADSAGGNDGTLGSTGDLDDNDPLWVDSQVPPTPCALEGFVERSIDRALTIKTKILDQLQEAIGYEDIALNVLETYFGNRDFGSSSKRDVVKAKQRIHQAIQHEEQAADSLDKSVENLEQSMESLDL